MVLEKFLKYVAFDTQSDPASESIPSTDKQKLLGQYLVDELQAMGVENAHMDEYGYVYAHLKGNKPEAKTIGFLAHMDTSFDFSGENVKPRIIKDYDGLDIELNPNLYTTVETFPFLSELKGQTLVVTDGTTLLGADDKAGMAEIMTLVDYLMNNEVERGDISICFTPDEEIGRGANMFNYKLFNAEFAYTLDGGPVGSIEYENFNAASAIVNITGKSIHPGDSKNKMINAIQVGMHYNFLLDQNATPEHTEGYEGFIHLHDMVGETASAKLEYIIRDHDAAAFAAKKAEMKRAADFINQSYNAEIIDLTIEDSYYNMANIINEQPYIIRLAEAAIQDAGLDPVSLPIRGGTDGARLTYEGLPTPNLGTGGYNYHGPHEFAVVEQMERSVEIMKNIVKRVGEA
ncbi:MAG: peptidase T [Erysipelothrix sp.]|nr:peptidase T [Erysipelothrix sp.]